MKVLNFVVSSFFLFFNILHINGQNYCYMKGCTNFTHIACNNDGVSVVQCVPRHYFTDFLYLFSHSTNHV
jgi:hypothetical protein